MCLSSLPVNMPVSCVCLIVLVEIEKRGVGAPRTGVQVVVSCECWEFNLGPVEEPVVLLLLKHPCSECLGH